MKKPAWLLLLSLCAACQGTHKLSDPTLVLQTRGGSELGVSTDYGIVFLGRTARSGDVEIMAWYGDGPSIESTVIEPVEKSIFTAETEIRLPSVPLTFVEPVPGQEVLLVGRKNLERWEKRLVVRSDPAIDGILLDIPREMRNAPDQIGAGVFVSVDDDYTNKRLVGLVAGQVALSGPEGKRSYLAVIGPKKLWRLATHRKDLMRRKPWVYRDDIL